MADYRVFVSYSRADKPQVLDLIRKIEAETGVRCWIDLTGVESGSQFEDIIIKAIDRSEVFLLMVSDTFLQSQWTKREVYYAETEKKRIVPISLDGKPLRGWVSFHFGHIDYIDSTSPEQVAKLCSNIRSWLEMDPESKGSDTAFPVAAVPVSPVPVGKKERNRRWLVPVLFAALLAIAACAFSLFKRQSVKDSSIATLMEIPADSLEEAAGPKPDSAAAPKINRPKAPRPDPATNRPQEGTSSRQPASQPVVETPVAALSSQEASAEPTPANIQEVAPKKALTRSANTHGVSNGHEWVDMGTGVKWATVNLGASAPDDFGAYYAWGELNTKDDYSWPSYKYGHNSNSLTKYCSTPNDGMDGFADMMTKLQLEDDIAHTEWGGNWRLPTHAELTAMISQCTSTWTVRNGHEGVLFTSTTTGEEIFFPAAGFRANTGYNGVGQSGRYWSSSLNSDGSASAWGLYFDSSKSLARSNKRVNGFSIRPVLE